jgi:hypothetical protein
VPSHWVLLQLPGDEHAPAGTQRGLIACWIRKRKREGGVGMSGHVSVVAAAAAAAALGWHG